MRLNEQAQGDLNDFFLVVRPLRRLALRIRASSISTIVRETRTLFVVLFLHPRERHFDKMSPREARQRTLG
jgi:hypothetical protein